MIDGAQRMDRMIRDLLNYSRALNDEGTFEPTELRATLLWAMSNLEVLFEAKAARRSLTTRYPQSPAISCACRRYFRTFWGMPSSIAARSRP